MKEIGVNEIDEEINENEKENNLINTIFNNQLERFE